VHRWTVDTADPTRFNKLGEEMEEEDMEMLVSLPAGLHTTLQFCGCHSDG